MELKVINLSKAIQANKVNTAIEEQIAKKDKQYEGDFKRFQAYAVEQGLPLSIDTLEAYLLNTIEQGLKLSTFNKRLASIKHFLVHKQGLEFTAEHSKRISLLKQMYNEKEYIKNKEMKGKSAQPKDEVMGLINTLGTRAKAIALVNLITANRPSEMITLKIGDFDLDNRQVTVHLHKQKKEHVKALTLEVVNAVKDYIKAYNLKESDYFVGKVDRHDNYTSAEVTDVAYRKMINKWLGFAPYTLRKSQVSAMHKNGACLSTIAKQSGHSSLQTLQKHYLEVDTSTVEQYL